MWLYSQLGGSAFALVGLAVLGVVDVWATPANMIRKGTKGVWFAIAAVPIVGSLAWLMMARPTMGTARHPTTGRRAKGGLRVIDGGCLDNAPNALGQREQLNAEIERSKDLNRRLEEWEAQNRRGPRPEAPAADPNVGDTGDSTGATISDDELQATLEQWRAELGDP